MVQRAGCSILKGSDLNSEKLMEPEAAFLLYCTCAEAVSRRLVLYITITKISGFRREDRVCRLLAPKPKPNFAVARLAVVVVDSYPPP